MIAESSELEEISEENIEAGFLQIGGVESNKLVFENGHVSKKGLQSLVSPADDLKKQDLKTQHKALSLAKSSIVQDTDFIGPPLPKNFKDQLQSRGKGSENKS